MAKQAALENVVYIEVRFAPELSMDQGLTIPETIDAVCDGLRQAQDEFGIVAKALVCGMRQSDQEVTSRILAEANQVSDQDFVGFDFAGMSTTTLRRYSTFNWASQELPSAHDASCRWVSLPTLC